jgi:SpoIID/LytB domain protein
VTEPTISVGVMTVEGVVHFCLRGPFRLNRRMRLSPGEYTARLEGRRISLMDGSGKRLIQDRSICLLPDRNGEDHFVLREVPVGTGFHWQKRQDLLFQGECRIYPCDEKKVQLVNSLPLEIYLASVVGSEMRGTAPIEFLKAHAVISRSWALRRIRKKDRATSARASHGESSHGETILRWTGAGIHQGFDVCADDHCQRYRGILEDMTFKPEQAVRETRGVVLTYEDEVCDTRYSKCCGGMTENFNAAWNDRDIPYLSATPDGDRYPRGFVFPLSVEKNAQAWVTGTPDAFCNTVDQGLLDAVLLPLDRPTTDFFRWQTVLSQEDICRTIAEKTGRDLGRIRDLLPLERGASGRIIRLRIVGTSQTLTVGKELEIRRVLSPTHLYSSALVIQKDPGGKRIPTAFRLIGAGWGHGVGLCQIGAAVMATRGKTHGEILQHYFLGTHLRGGYGDSEVR